MQRVILHADLNNFYATVERVLYPELQDIPLAICGDREARHGIVLAKCEKAKAKGVKTGDTIWQAKKKCPNIVFRPPRFQEYIAFSKKVRNIYAQYTDFIEPFGIDECWLDVTKSEIFGDGITIANTIRERVKQETKLTISVGVSYNKVFAKLASDMQKPDAVIAIFAEDVQTKIYPLPVEMLLYVGRSTAKKLNKIGIYTIGELAKVESSFLEKYLGKWGKKLSIFARGEDETPVHNINEPDTIKSVGNSLTYPKDLYKYEEIKKVFYLLAESVSKRLQKNNLGKACTVKIYVKDKMLQSYTWQRKVQPIFLCEDIAQTAFHLFCNKYKIKRGIRMLGISVTDFEKDNEQLSFEMLQTNSIKKEKMNTAIANIRSKYGFHSIQRAILLQEDKKINDIEATHLARPSEIYRDVLEEEVQEDKGNHKNENNI